MGDAGDNRANVDRLAQQLSQSLAGHDPVEAIESAELAAMTDRLLASWETMIATADSDNAEMESPTVQSNHAKANAEPAKRFHLNWTLAAAAIVLGLMFTAAWWRFSDPPVIDPIAQVDDPNDHQPNSMVENANKDPDQSKATEAIATNSTDPSQQQLDSDRVTSVGQLLDLPPRLVQVRLRNADQQKLQKELTTWLKDWHLANPMQRRDMEDQWVSRRQFWLVWSMQSLEQFQDSEVQSAAIELISLDLGGSAKPFLERCLANEKLSEAALPHWIPLADDRQLVAWLQTARDCGQVRRVLQQLAGRNSVDATHALAGVAAQSHCRQLLPQVEDWNPVHRQRAMASVGRGNSRGEFQSAMLLAAIPDRSIDQQLLDSIQRGVQILPATAVLLLRDDSQATHTLAKVQQSPLVASALTSARLQVQRWHKQAEQNQNSISQEVCKQCEQKS